MNILLEPILRNRVDNTESCINKKGFQGMMNIFHIKNFLRERKNVSYKVEFFYADFVYRFYHKIFYSCLENMNGKKSRPQDHLGGPTALFSLLLLMSTLPFLMSSPPLNVNFAPPNVYFAPPNFNFAPPNVYLAPFNIYFAPPNVYFAPPNV